MNIVEFCQSNGCFDKSFDYICCEITHLYFSAFWLNEIEKFFTVEDYETSKNETYLLLLRQDSVNSEVKYFSFKSYNIDKPNKNGDDKEYTLKIEKNKIEDLVEPKVYLDIVVVDKFVKENHPVVHIVDN